MYKISFNMNIQTNLPPIQQQKFGILSLQGYSSGINMFTNKLITSFHRSINSLSYATYCVPIVSLKLRQCSFPLRCTEHWNNLPTSVVKTTSLPSFERRLDKHWNNLPLKLYYLDDTTATRAQNGAPQGVLHST